MTEQERANWASVCLVPGFAPSTVKRRITPPGFDYRTMNRGHLIAKQLGGSGLEPGNIVPLYIAANNAMKPFENQVRRIVEGYDIRYRQQQIYFLVRANFTGKDPVPYSVTLYGRGSRGYSLTETIGNTPP
jgi:DNA/RNA non-specific endonuclease